LEIVISGKVVATVAGGADSTTLEIDRPIEVDGATSAWIAARAEGESSEFFLPRQLLAHTNPVYAKGDRPQRSAEDARFFMKEIDGLIQWVKTKGVFHDRAHREEVTKLFESARRLYEAQTREAGE
jgi:hypothetical protein